MNVVLTNNSFRHKDVETQRFRREEEGIFLQQSLQADKLDFYCEVKISRNLGTFKWRDIRLLFIIYLFCSYSLIFIFLISHFPSKPLAGQFHSDDPNHCLVNVVVPVLIIGDILIILSLTRPCVIIFSYFHPDYSCFPIKLFLKILRIIAIALWLCKLHLTKKNLFYEIHAINVFHCI